MPLKIHLTIASSIVLCLMMFLTTANVSANDFVASQAQFEKGLRGDKEANKQAYAGFTILVERHPDNPLYLAYLGSNETLFARDSWMPWKRMRYLDSGLDRIDKALTILGPEHDAQFERGSVISIETRLVALTTFLNVPSFANRFQDAKDLFALTLQQPMFSKAPAEVRQRIYLQGADIAAKEEQNKQVLEYLNKALMVKPEGHYADLARTKLEELEQ